MYDEPRMALPIAPLGSVVEKLFVLAFSWAFVYDGVSLDEKKDRSRVFNMKEDGS